MKTFTYPNTFAVVGGDLRHKRLAALLNCRGCPVTTFAIGGEHSDLKAVGSADCVILPLPVSAGAFLNAPLWEDKLALDEILETLGPQQLIFGGMVDGELSDEFSRRGLTCYDYFSREELAAANAVPTAEGAIALAMGNTARTISASRCLVLGYGRIGRALSSRLRGLGALVTVCARGACDRQWAQNDGCAATELPLLEALAADFDIVFNTIPAPVVGKKLLERLRGDCLIIDLASRPGGVDFEQASKLRLTTFHALSLPGKVAPITAAEAVFSAITNILRELEVRN